MALGETAAGSFGYRLKLRVSAIVWFVLGLGFLLSLPVLVDVSWFVVLVIAVIAAILGLLAAWIVRALFRNQRRQRFGTSYLKAWAALLFVLAIIVATPIYFLALATEFRPLVVPQATLSNGKKTVVFQGMMHIGSEGFYKSVVYDLEKALDDGYVIYYEGVMPSPDGDKWFNDTLAGGGDLSDNYKTMASLCGLSFQLDYFGLLRTDMAAHPERHIAADVTTADMMHEYERLVAEDPDFAARMAEQKADDAADKGSSGGLSGIIGMVSNGTPDQRRLAGTICRGGLSMLLGGKAKPSPMDPVILDFRNRALAERIGADSHQLIYITYGAEHLPGVLALLKAQDPAWDIQSLKWSRTVETPEELTGKL
jgi:hypothetical protein